VALAALLDDIADRRGIRSNGLAGWQGPRRAAFDAALAHHQRSIAEVAARCRATATRIRRAAAVAGQAPTAW
jgi:hypothetical protein